MPDQLTPPSQVRPSMAAAANPVVKTMQAYVALIRATLRDYPELNRLMIGKETSDREIAMAVMMALEDWNNTPPLLTAVGLTDFPAKNLLIDGSIVRILLSVGLLQTRNHLTYTDGQGVQNGISDKGPAMQQWANLFASSYEQKKVQLKRAINLRDALGGRPVGVSTELLLINGFLDSLPG